MRGEQENFAQHFLVNSREKTSMGNFSLTTHQTHTSGGKGVGEDEKFAQHFMDNSREKTSMGNFSLADQHTVVWGVGVCTFAQLLPVHVMPI
jgi:hypothetical protein